MAAEAYDGSESEGICRAEAGLHGIATHMYDVTVAYTGFELGKGKRAWSL